jgi:hypothetical protein
MFVVASSCPSHAYGHTTSELRAINVAWHKLSLSEGAIGLRMRQRASQGSHRKARTDIQDNLDPETDIRIIATLTI